MKRCRQCPYRKNCRDVCYGDAPCDFARAFDSLDRKLKWWQAKAKAIEAAAKPIPEPQIFGNYVFSPWPEMRSTERRVGGSARRVTR